MDEERLRIERARGGDGPDARAAFEALVRAHQGAVYGLAMRMVRDHDEADEIAQRTFVRAWSSLRAFEGRSSFRTWVLTICANLCRNHHRDRARFRDEPAPELVAEEAPAGERLERAEVLARLQEAVAALPARQREVVELRVYQGLPFREVAGALSITENNAKVSFHHAVKALRARLGEAVAGLASMPAARRDSEGGIR